MLPPVQVQVQDVPSNDTNDILAVMAQTGEPLNKADTGNNSIRKLEYKAKED